MRITYQQAWAIAQRRAESLPPRMRRGWGCPGDYGLLADGPELYVAYDGDRTNYTTHSARAMIAWACSVGTPAPLWQRVPPDRGVDGIFNVVLKRDGSILRTQLNWSSARLVAVQAADFPGEYEVVEYIDPWAE